MAPEIQDGRHLGHNYFQNNREIRASGTSNSSSLKVNKNPDNWILFEAVFLDTEATLKITKFSNF